MIFDCFMFYNELEILRLRLIELYDVVDRFVITESTYTFTGKAKPLFFAEHRADFSDFADKIVHVVADDMAVSRDPWENEAFQRNAMLRGIDDLELDDWIIISDVDEIPRASIVSNLQRSSLMMAGFRMPLSYFKLNYVNIEGEPNSVWAMAVRPMALSTPQNVRDRRWNMMDSDFVAAAPNIEVFDHAGWHFSYLGNEDHVRKKLAAYSHQEFNQLHITESLNINSILAAKTDIFGRIRYKWDVVPVSDSFPAEVRTNQSRYAHLIAACSEEVG